MTKELTIAGLNVGHDGGCALLVGDQVRYAIAEERLNRYKYSPGWLNALFYCLSAANIGLDDVDAFVFSGYGPPLPEGFDGGLITLRSKPGRYMSVDHHLSHAIGAFALSPFDEALIIAMDGWGNGADTESYYLGRGTQIERIGGNSPERSRAKGIGACYEAFTNFLGFSDLDAGKTMGLAAYGNPDHFQEPLYTVQGDQVASYLEETHQFGVMKFAKRTGLDFGPCFPDHASDNAKNVAAYVQRQTELAILQLVRNLMAATGLSTLCLSGGAALNCLVNTQIRETVHPERLFILPFASDTGQAIGNALYGYYVLTGQLPRHSLRTCFFGRTYPEREILEGLARAPGTVRYDRVLWSHYSYTKESNVARCAAQLLADGKVIGWFQGGSELGPRALGHRSILADPRDHSMRDVINKRVKHREWFRPFAPSLIADDAASLLGSTSISPFMLEAPHIGPDMASKLTAALHVDGTARVQLVDEREDPLFYELISCFREITGVPAVLNTSFNVREPIVETPGDAVFTFLTSDLDCLLIGDFLVTKTAE